MSNLISREEAIKCLEMFLDKQCDRERTKARGFSDNDIWAAVNMAYDALSDENVGKWIPVSERLPEGDKEVLVTSDWGFLYIAEYEVFSDGVGRWSETVEWRFIDVTAWMPLPEPYKEEVME